ncbi:Rhs_assc_core: RHS repeat-associated core domain [Romboutsia lituseburensis]|uniref:RHS repeat-associated core domain-containing protein n=1 Tax=Romboutsia lituseburensis DSM 797 TaxID=1121325 RepID=A0A1G9PKS1_9FIRM|nr:Rhs_assc_core: RHS repeat-associated core domain [Romboutsia lituseburensis]SDL99153.1 RHS repeat-associated core domain-containing protein [Romboutsia lituseburensis DSM 797]
MQSRYYNPEWGRFLNADGIVGETGELLSHNMFAYCNNNPVNREDPTGFKSKVIAQGFYKNVNKLTINLPKSIREIANGKSKKDKYGYGIGGGFEAGLVKVGTKNWSIKGPSITAGTSLYTKEQSLYGRVSLAEISVSKSFRLKKIGKTVTIGGTLTLGSLGATYGRKKGKKLTWGSHYGAGFEATYGIK